LPTKEAALHRQEAAEAAATAASLKKELASIPEGTPAKALAQAKWSAASRHAKNMQNVAVVFNESTAAEKDAIEAEEAAEAQHRVIDRLPGGKEREEAKAKLTNLKQCALGKKKELVDKMAVSAATHQEAVKACGLFISLPLSLLALARARVCVYARVCVAPFADSTL